MSNHAVTLHVLDGADRGRTFSSLHTPVTIGREEGNSVQLNDERVSRFHLKIQEDHDRVVLTDLDSTNGTKVNGEDTRLHILRFGDMITVGRSVLLFGSREQIAERLAALRKERAENEPASDEPQSEHPNPPSLDFELWPEGVDEQEILRWQPPPELPHSLSPCQAAELNELLSFFHVRLRHLLASVQPTEDDRVTLGQREWQNLLDLQFTIASYSRSISEPSDDPPGGFSNGEPAD